MRNGIAGLQDARINENKVRLNALWVFILVTLSIFYAGLPIVVFLAIDFFLRGFNFGKFSPLAKLSDLTIKQLNIANKPIFQAPKRFAARIGFILSLLILTSYVFQFDIAALGLSIVFSIFAFLESFLGFCAGCYVYSFLIQLKLIKP